MPKRMMQRLAGAYKPHLNSVSGIAFLAFWPSEGTGAAAPLGDPFTASTSRFTSSRNNLRVNSHYLDLQVRKMGWRTVLSSVPWTAATTIVRRRSIVKLHCGMADEF